MLAVVDLAQMQDRALHHATARTAPAFDNAPITVFLAVLPSPRESQVHGPRSYAQSKIRKEGRSSGGARSVFRPSHKQAGAERAVVATARNGENVFGRNRAA